MTLLNEATRALIGVQGVLEVACDPVESGAVRRFAQATMDEDPAYASAEAGARYGGAVAPPLFPMCMFRRPFGAPDPIQANADNPDFDGIAGTIAQGLPPLPLPPMVLLNGGTEVEFFRYARHGERITGQSRYLDIVEKIGKQGPFIVVLIETIYRGMEGDPVLRVVKTLLRRPA